jgi:hypothetical protein
VLEDGVLEARPATRSDVVNPLACGKDGIVCIEWTHVLFLDGVGAFDALHSFANGPRNGSVVDKIHPNDSVNALGEPLPAVQRHPPAPPVVRLPKKVSVVG